MNNRLDARESNFELLRIVAMAFIVICHCMGNGTLVVLRQHQDFAAYFAAPVINRLFISTAGLLGGIGNGIFFMISGYFMSQRNATTRKITNIYLQMLFYMLITILIYFPTKYFGFYSYEGMRYGTKGLLLRALIPLSGSVWWFATTYVLLYLSSPAINNLINLVRQRGLALLILYVFIICQVRPFDFLHYSPLLNAVLYYMLGSYIRLYTRRQSIRHYKTLDAAVFLSVSIAVWALLFIADRQNMLNIMGGGDVPPSAISKI